MRNIFIVSDTHFGHANMLKFVDEHGKHFRIFDDVEEMNEVMVQNWNSVVTDQDIVYHLGDVYFGDGAKVLPRLRGSKRLILGNHDEGKDPILQKHFQKILMWRMFPEFDALLTHVPVHPSMIEHPMAKVKFNLHGHIHQNLSPAPNYVNCCVEMQNYTPKHIEDLIPR